MLSHLQDFFTRFLGDADYGGDKMATQRSDVVALATVALLIEVSLADAEQQEEELKVIESIARTSFNLHGQPLHDLIKAAQREVDEAVSIHGFTRLLNTRLQGKERIAIIEHLWRLAYADQLLDKYEEYYIRKIADLLYVSHADYIKAKHRGANQRSGDTTL